MVEIHRRRGLRARRWRRGSASRLGSYLWDVAEVGKVSTILLRLRVLGAKHEIGTA